MRRHCSAAEFGRCDVEQSAGAPQALGAFGGRVGRKSCGLPGEQRHELAVPGFGAPSRRVRQDKGEDGAEQTQAQPLSLSG